MATKEDIDRLEKSLHDLLQLNTTLSSQVSALQKENDEIKRATQSTVDRITTNKEKWQKAEEDVVQPAKLPLLPLLPPLPFPF